MPQAKLNVPLSIALRQETYDKLVGRVRDVSPAEILSARAAEFLEFLADGGVMLKPDDVTKIDQAIGKPIKNAKDIVGAVLRGAGITDGGESVFQFSLDPVYAEAFSERAREVDKTPGELMGEVVDQALELDWMMGINPTEGRRLTFMPAQQNFFARELGKKDFTIDDIVRFMKESRKAEAA